MKCSLVYPKIPSPRDCPLKKCLAFEKYDGTNLHWVREKGIWSHFGTRRDRFELNDDGIKSFNEKHPGMEDAVDLFKSSYTFDHLGDYLIDNKYQGIKHDKVIVFTEFLGNNSFAGQHQKNDTKKLVLIDISIDDRFINPYQLSIDVDQFDDNDDNISGNRVKGFHCARILYSGKYNGKFIEDVRQGKYTKGEGVVCKGIVSGEIYMTKIKTNLYLERLKNEFPRDWKNYWE